MIFDFISQACCCELFFHRRKKKPTRGLVRIVVMPCEHLRSAAFFSASPSDTASRSRIPFKLLGWSSASREDYSRLLRCVSFATSWPAA